MAAMGKVDRFCTMHLSAKTVRFVLAPGVVDGVELWAGMAASSLFDSMVVESQSANEITLHVQVDHLERALRSGQTAQDVAVKLSKRGPTNAAVLCFVADIQTPQVMTVTQDVPVTVLPGSHWATLTEPSFPPPDVHIFLPKLRALRSVVDHLKNITDTVTISASMAGQFTLEVQTASVQITTTYTGLGTPPMATDPSKPTETSPSSAATAQPKPAEAKATVDIGKFIKFLHCHQVQPNTVIFCMCRGHSLVFHAVLDDVYMTYYLSCIS